MRKKIVMYFNTRVLEKDPFSTFGKKRSVYHAFFKLGMRRGFEMYIANKENHLRGLQFKNPYKYNGKFFELCQKTIRMDAVLDRSAGLFFPKKNIGNKVLNNIELKKICNDKNGTQKLLKIFMPKSYRIKNQQQLKEKLLLFNQNSLAVLKPAKGMCGKGVLINNPKELAYEKIRENVEYVLQEFIDTSKGIRGIINKHHDLRVVIVNGKITLCHVRSPKKGSLLANVAQGGSIKEVALNKIPKFIKKTVHDVQECIDKKFDYPLYSIDFGIQNKDQAFVFELNDQIGFPSSKMKGKTVFLKAVLDSLEKRF